MSAPSWTLDASVGQLLLRTRAAGRAARLGHDLTIAMNTWEANVSWSGGEPAAVHLTVDVSSLDVLSGEGGVKSLSGPEKAIVRSNALNALDAKRHPTIIFRSDAVEKTDDGYRLIGSLDIHGKTRPRTIVVHTEDLGDAWRMSAESVVRQSEFGVKPYSLFMGTLKVADDVTVSVSATRAKAD